MAYTTPNEAIQRIKAVTQSVHRLMTVPGIKVQPIELVREIGETDGNVYLLRKGQVSMIAPGDDTLPPVIGESEDADFTIDLPPSLEEWLYGYSREIDWMQRFGDVEAAPEKAAEAAVAEDIAALIKTKWNQTAPWNQNLTFEGKKCYVGCVPIAIGQLLYYWAKKGYRRGCTASEAYITKTNLYEVGALPPVTSFDFDHMVTGKPTTAAAKKAVADMLEKIGKAVHADYKPTATGVRHADSDPRLTTCFRLGSKITRIYASKMGVPAFCERIRKELGEGRPVLMTGSNSGGSSTHAFLCDGYRAGDDKFHFNWGWGGTYDGYYKMTALKPSSTRNYSYYKSAVVNVQPEYILGDVNHDGSVDVSDVLGAVDDMLDGKYQEEADVNYDGKVDGEDVKAVVNHILGKEKL